MLLIKSFLLTKIFLQLNIYILILSLLIGFILLYFNNFFSYFFSFKYYSSFIFLKFFLIFSLIISFFLFVCSFYLYLNYIYLFIQSTIFDFCFIPKFICFSKFKFFNLLSFKWITIYLTIDIFGYILLLLAYIVGFISIIILDNRLNWKVIKYLFAFNVFVLIVFFYVSVTNLIVFFLLYEFLLVPSFLFVYFVSPSRRALQASIYFVIWTQIGSFLVLCAIAYIIITSNNFLFFLFYFYNFSNFEVWFLYIFLFLGFGFKVPIWPFHYWLTKTHVEAPSGFSIYLSGFLVKSALFGFYKLTNILSCHINTSVFVIICLFGVIDASLKMWGQTDLKKLVAYGTIQEMNIIYLVFCWGDSIAIISGILFTATHAFLSALMFFVVDCIYRRFFTRSIIEINGLLQINPNLSFLIILMIIFFAGLPGTLKFVVEFYIFAGLLELSLVLTFVLIFVANVLGLIGFSKNWFNLIFGISKKNFKVLPLDLTYKEIYISFLCFAFLLFFSFFTNFLF